LQAAIVNGRGDRCPHRGLPLFANLPLRLANFPLFLEPPLPFELVELPLEVVENGSYERVGR
jgi:hypothetical protein